MLLFKVKKKIKIWLYLYDVEILKNILIFKNLWNMLRCINLCNLRNYVFVFLVWFRIIRSLYVVC